MKHTTVIATILVTAVTTFALRAAPSVIFHGQRKMPDWLDRLGKMLPSAIMAVLIVYCLKDIGDDWIGIGIPRMLAVAIVVFSYKWKHSTLLSIVSGTAAYMLFLPLF
ncbi:MAG: AzlD domain-containing protein [Oscillospiraceae bacterium]|jgi:branched-subunit amino acid transport protein AzlD|nr:AzlD domain-containing protein [Oscillospiraceae bacterium]